MPFADSGKRVFCLCAPLCPNGESHGKCETSPGGKCFTATERIIENGEETLIVEYGCLPPDIMALLQVSGEDNRNRNSETCLM